MSRYGRYGGGKGLGPSERRFCGCSEYLEAVGFARRLGDGYSACVMAASAHTIRSRRRRGRGARKTGDGGGRSRWGFEQFLGLFLSPSLSRVVAQFCYCPSLSRPPVPPPPALGCHFAHIDDHGGAFPWRFPATLADRCAVNSGVNLRLS